MKGGGASKKRLQVSRFKLDALLDLTLSINANIPAAELLLKYESILRGSLKIGKILIFKRSPAWEPILNAGFPQNIAAAVNVDKDLMPFSDIAFVTDDSHFPGVDIIIPVSNNNVLQAFVLIGDIDEEGELVSPVIKHLRFIQTLSGIIVVAIENIRLFNESLRQEALRKELELAARMQQMLIPEDLQMPQGNLISARGFYFPHYEVGGDYYDCIRLSPHKTGICIADVSGKGMPAALLMSNFQASLRALFTHDISLVSLVEKLNDLIMANAYGEKFITLFLARFDSETATLEYVNAAHNPPVLYDTVKDEVRHLHPLCVGVGMLDEIPPFKSITLHIDNYTKLVCYTDGLSELKGSDGKEIMTREIINVIGNDEPAGDNISIMLGKLGIPDNNPTLFDDISIIALDLMR